MGKHSKTSNDTEARIDRLAQEFSNAYENIAEQIKELSKRIDHGLYRAEMAPIEAELAPIPNEYQRAEVLRMAANANLHPDQIVPTAQKFLAFVSGESTVNPSEQARKVDLINATKRDFVNDLMEDYVGLSDSHTVTVGQVRQVLRRAAGLS